MHLRMIFFTLVNQTPNEEQQNKYITDHLTYEEVTGMRYLQSSGPSLPTVVG